MAEFSALAPQELQDLRADLMKRYAAICDRKLSLDITRSKPSAEQLDLSNGLLENVATDGFRSPDGTDCRNYGGLEGLPRRGSLRSGSPRTTRRGR